MSDQQTPYYHQSNGKVCGGTADPSGGDSSCAHGDTTTTTTTTTTSRVILDPVGSIPTGIGLEYSRTPAAWNRAAAPGKFPTSSGTTLSGKQRGAVIRKFPWKACRQFDSFVGTTHVTGISYLHSSYPIWFRLFWVALMATLVALMIVQIFDLTEQYRNDPVATSIHFEHPGYQKFPNVLICPRSQLKASNVFESYGYKIWEFLRLSDDRNDSKKAQQEFENFNRNRQKDIEARQRALSRLQTVDREFDDFLRRDGHKYVLEAPFDRGFTNLFEYDLAIAGYAKQKPGSVWPYWNGNWTNYARAVEEQNALDHDKLRSSAYINWDWSQAIPMPSLVEAEIFARKFHNRDPLRYEDILRTGSASMEETLAGCELNHHDCLSAAREIYTEFGHCFLINSSQSSASESTNKHALHIQMHSDQRDDLFVQLNQSDFRVWIFDDSLMNNQIFELYRSDHVVFPIRLRRTIDRGTNCSKDEKYSKNACEIRRFVQFAKDQCHCLPFIGTSIFSGDEFRMDEYSNVGAGSSGRSGGRSVLPKCTSIQEIFCVNSIRQDRGWLRAPANKCSEECVQSFYVTTAQHQEGNKYSQENLIKDTWRTKMKKKHHNNLYKASVLRKIDMIESVRNYSKFWFGFNAHKRAYLDLLSHFLGEAHVTEVISKHDVESQPTAWLYASSYYIYDLMNVVVQNDSRSNDLIVWFVEKHPETTLLKSHCVFLGISMQELLFVAARLAMFTERDQLIDRTAAQLYDFLDCSAFCSLNMPNITFDFADHKGIRLCTHNCSCYDKFKAFKDTVASSLAFYKILLMTSNYWKQMEILNYNFDLMIHEYATYGVTAMAPGSIDYGYQYRAMRENVSEPFEVNFNRYAKAGDSHLTFNVKYLHRDRMAVVRLWPSWGAQLRNIRSSCFEIQSQLSQILDLYDTIIHAFTRRSDYTFFEDYLWKYMQIRSRTDITQWNQTLTTILNFYLAQESFLNEMEHLYRGSLKFLKWSNISQSYIEANTAEVSIYFSELSTEVITKESAYSFWRMLSDIGGTVGLYVGCCVATLFELLISCTHLERRIKKTPSSSSMKKGSSRGGSERSVAHFRNSSGSGGNEGPGSPQQLMLIHPPPTTNITTAAGSQQQQPMSEHFRNYPQSLQQQHGLNNNNNYNSNNPIVNFNNSYQNRNNRRPYCYHQQQHLDPTVLSSPLRPLNNAWASGHDSSLMAVNLPYSSNPAPPAPRGQGAIRVRSGSDQDDDVRDIFASKNNATTTIPPEDVVDNDEDEDGAEDDFMIGQNPMAVLRTGGRQGSKGRLPDDDTSSLAMMRSSGNNINNNNGVREETEIEL